MLSVIGLALDIIGASLVALGLFRPASQLFPGAGRWPETAAADQAFGGVGVTFLICGFVTQALPPLGVEQPSGCAVIAGVITLGVGGTVAYLLFGLVYIVRLPREVDRLRRAGTQRPRVVRKGDGLRFWHHEHEESDGEGSR